MDYRIILLIVSIFFYNASIAEEISEKDAADMRVYFRQGSSILEPGYKKQRHSFKPDIISNKRTAS